MGKAAVKGGVMNIAEKMAREYVVAAYGNTWLNTKADREFIGEIAALIATVAERAIDEAQKVVRNEVDHDMMAIGLCGDIEDNRWWEEEGT